MAIRYIGQRLAQQIDEELMSAAGAFTLEQLMELAGLSCAQAVYKTFPVDSHKRVLVCCGPGNQGGDGLVAARHLHHLAYKPTLYYPKPGKNEFYQKLQTQATNLGVPLLSSVDEFRKALSESDVVLDAIFGAYVRQLALTAGFSFHPPVRAPFDDILSLLAESPTPIVSVDIPSGWNVETGQQRLTTQPDDKGNTREVRTIDPAALVSLTAPKEGVKAYTGRHWLGGRFVPDSLAKKYELNLPPYPGIDQVVELPTAGGKL